MAKVTKAQFRKGIADLSLLMQHDYDCSLDDVMLDRDREMTRKRLWRMAGVALKREYSVAERRAPGGSPTRAKYKWVIDRKKLARRVRGKKGDVRVLATLDSRQKGESVQSFALRLKYETAFGRVFVKSIHKYICGDAEVNRKVAAFFKKFGLPEMGKQLTFEQLIKMGANALATYLRDIVPELGLAGQTVVAIVTVAICNLGLRGVCSGTRR